MLVCYINNFHLIYNQYTQYKQIKLFDYMMIYFILFVITKDKK